MLLIVIFTTEHNPKLCIIMYHYLSSQSKSETQRSMWASFLPHELIPRCHPQTLKCHAGVHLTVVPCLDKERRLFHWSGRANENARMIESCQCRPLWDRHGHVQLMPLSVIVKNIEKTNFLDYGFFAGNWRFSNFLSRRISS